MDPIVGDPSRAIDELELHRLHYTYSLVDLRTFREDYRYVYRNADTRPHRVVPLLWRWREIQANMVVLDAADENLIYLPIGITRQAEEAYLESPIRKGIQKIPRGQSPNPTRLTAFRQSIQLALQFESAQEVRVEAYNLAHQLATDFPEIQEFTRVTTFLALLSEFYMLGVDRFLDLLGLLLVVVLTIGIFAVDKRILREFVSAHASVRRSI